MATQAQIIPVASGKGGVGKSFLSANLAIGIARRSFKTIAVDLDLGGSNLYSYLGMTNDNPGLGDYFREKKALRDYVVKTGLENLEFIPGEGRTTFMANLNYLQKKKLIRELSKLNAAYIILDLGAGTTYNTLDFFDLANNGIVVSSFEVPAVMNTLTFLKNCLFRKISSHFRNEFLIYDKLNTAMKESSNENPLSIKDLIEMVTEINTSKAEEMKELLRKFNPRILFNMVSSKEELELVKKVDQGIVKNLSLSVEYFGIVRYSAEVKNSIFKREVFYNKYIENIAHTDINTIVSKIVSNKNIIEPNSMENMLQLMNK